MQNTFHLRSLIPTLKPSRRVKGRRSDDRRPIDSRRSRTSTSFERIVVRNKQSHFQQALRGSREKKSTLPFPTEEARSSRYHRENTAATAANSHSRVAFNLEALDREQRHRLENGTKELRHPSKFKTGCGSSSQPTMRRGGPRTWVGSPNRPLTQHPLVLPWCVCVCLCVAFTYKV